MIWWGIIVFGLGGWILAELESYGLVIGGLIGWAVGASLRKAVRSEIRLALAEFQSVPAELSAGSEEPEASIVRTPASPWETGDAAGPESELAGAEPEAIPELPPEPEVISLGERAAAMDAPAEQPLRESHYAEELPGKLFTAARDWLMGGNPIVRVGLLILFVGLSFLVRYAANYGLLPIELRLAAVGAVGAALVAVGYNRRAIRPDFALVVQGAGVAVLYLTVFAAARQYGLLPPLPAFALMVVFCALGCALALLQNAQGLALAAFLGGFAVPVLLGGEAETPMGLFTYGTILNLAILFIAWKRSWRLLNLLGFFATFGLATLWGLDAYEPRHFLVCQLFLAASVLIYLFTAILYAHNTPGKLGNVADNTLLFGPAIAGFGLQAGLVQHYEYGSAVAALCFAAAYIGLAWYCLRQRREELRVLIECLGAIGIGFVTLAVPLALDVRWTSSAWALEGAGAFWVGMRQARWVPRLFGLLLQAVAALVLVTTLQTTQSAIPLLNGGFIGALLVAVPVLATAWWLRRPLPHSGSALASAYGRAEFSLKEVTFLSGFMLACLALALELTRTLPPATIGDWGEPALAVNLQRLGLMLAVLAAMAVSAWQGRKHGWAVATWPAQLSLLVLGAGFLAQLSAGRNVLYWPDAGFWFAAIALHAHLLRSEDRLHVDGSGKTIRGLFHAGTVWLGTGMLANALYLGIERARLWDTSWAGVIFLLSATAVLAGLTRWAGRRGAAGAAGLRWPLDPHARAYYWIAAVPLAALTLGGTLVTALLAEGVTDPLPYVPLINPVDLSLGLGLVALGAWRRMLRGAQPRGAAIGLVLDDAAFAAWAGLLFVVVNTVWLRTAHHWLGVEWSGEALMNSMVVQTGLSILWTLLAMALMILAHRRALRVVWLAGAALLVMVVLKLLLVDMSQSDSWERVVAFIGVGVLMLVIGYFAPLPPRKGETEGDTP